MTEEIYDVVVIGGGPAGMMAAGRAAQQGARVLLLEKNASLGAKLLITGGGRSNITNAEFDEHLFLAKFGSAAKFLFSPLSQFGVQDTLDFFHAQGMLTKIEAEKRVFPVSDQAQSVWDALARYMRAGQVEIRTGSAVAGIVVTDGRVAGVRLADGETLSAQAVILATGGKSHPETGSTGDGFRFLEAIGHTIAAPRPALVPLRVAEPWIQDWSGVSFLDVKLSVFPSGGSGTSSKASLIGRGKLLCTHVGLSGPLVLNMSRGVSEYLPFGPVSIALDLYPDQHVSEVDMTLQTLFATQKNKQVKNSLDGWLPPRVVPTLLGLAQINPETPVHSVTRAERLALGQVTKRLPLTVTGLLGTDKAIVTSGGVILEEVDCKYLRSRLYPNLYLVGDILNIDRPSGGYSLQLCWTTGFVAGTAAAQKGVPTDPQ